MAVGGSFHLVLIKVQEVKQKSLPTFLRAGQSLWCSLEVISTSGLIGWILHLLGFIEPMSLQST